MQPKKTVQRNKDHSRIADAALLDEFRFLWGDAEDLWDAFEDTAPFSTYVSGDFLAIYHALLELRDASNSFLEWGSGLGVATIMASRMGLQAFGIESESGLVEHANRLATNYQSTAAFAVGSFIPDDFFQSNLAARRFSRTATHLTDGYTKIGKRLSDFDIVYAYPWPDESELFTEVMRRYGSPSASFLNYDECEGLRTTTFS